MRIRRKRMVVGAVAVALLAAVLGAGIAIGMTIGSVAEDAPAEVRLTEPAMARPDPATLTAATAPTPMLPEVALTPSVAEQSPPSSAPGLQGASAPTPPPPAAPSPAPPPPAPAPPLQASGHPDCVENCGTPRYFCDTGGWAFCDDYRDLYCPSQQFLNDCKFPDMDGIGRHVSVVTYSSTDPNFYPQLDGAQTPHGWFFNQQEHFHSQIEDGAFGIAMARHHQPIDLGAERHIHFEADLKTSARRYIRLMLSPEVTKSMRDDRDPPSEFRPNRALDIWFINGTFVGSVHPGSADGGAFYVESPRYYGTDNVRDSVDVYVSRSHARILVNGVEYVNASLPDLGFDRAYVYLSQAAYNPCKDGECAQNLQVFHWDNFAFDGPVLPDNSIVPSGQQDVAFLAYGQASCTVKGVSAAPSGASDGYAWMTWVARMPAQPVSPADVQCVDGEGGYLWGNTGRTPFEFEVVAP